MNTAQDKEGTREIQSKTDIEKIRHLENRIADLEEDQMQLRSRLDSGRQADIREIRALYESRLSQCDLLMNENIEREVNKIKQSRTWKLGWIQVTSFLLLINFLKNPVRFLSSKQYRWRNIYYFHEPVSSVSAATIINGPSHDPDPSVQDTPAYKTDPEKLTVLAVFDTFTRSCFEPEFNLVCPGPGHWKKTIEQCQPDAIFIESAWHGNDNSWEFLTHSLSGAHKLETMKKMVEVARHRRIPTIFWNKEDPAHFNAFIDTARLFDHVFTSDADSVDRYKSITGNTQIYPLPFAAQPRIHNPVREGYDRDRHTCFAGSYYNQAYTERKIDLDLLLRPAMEYGLVIYDRNSGATGEERTKYGFPEQYTPFIRGRLDYGRMLRAYRQHKVFLNVNSIKYSPTMFARRVFEILACGTPVISNYSKGILELLGEDAVLITESSRETQNFLERLFYDPFFWWQQSLTGLRKVLEKHTYSDRAETVFSAAGLVFRRTPDPVFLVVSSIQTQEDALYLADILRVQHYKKFSVLLIINRDGSKLPLSEEGIRSLYDFASVTIVKIRPESDPLTFLPETGFSHVALMSTEHYYGRNYLRDYSLAVGYSNAAVFGKKALIGLSEEGERVFQSEGHEYIMVDKVHPGSLVFTHASFPWHEFFGSFRGADFTFNEHPVLSLDPFNFLPGGRNPYSESPGLVAGKIGI